MDINLILNIVSLIFLVASSIFLGLFTFLMLKFSAKPKLRVKVSPKDGENRLIFYESEKSTLRFYIENVGHWYAKPAATNVVLWVNFEPAFKPTKIRYGSALGKEDQTVRSGKGTRKGNSKYLKATGIYLFHEERGEAVEVDVEMPIEKGLYRFWLAAHSDQGDCGVHKFQLKIRPKEKRFWIGFNEGALPLH